MLVWRGTNSFRKAWVRKVETHKNRRDDLERWFESKTFENNFSKQIALECRRFLHSPKRSGWQISWNNWLLRLKSRLTVRQLTPILNFEDWLLLFIYFFGVQFGLNKSDAARQKESLWMRIESKFTRMAPRSSTRAPKNSKSGGGDRDDDCGDARGGHRDAPSWAMILPFW